MGKEMIKVFIVDDHSLIREGLKSLLREEADLEIVGEASNTEEMFNLLNKRKCDVLVLDISLPRTGGLDVLGELRARFPNVKILMLTMHPEERFAARAFKLGASGYVTKESVPRQLVTAIRKVVGGGVFVSPQFGESLALNLQGDVRENRHELLSDREFQILRLIASGKKVDEIARDLFLSKGTVYTYRSRILVKMELTNDAELTRYAVEHKLID